MGRESEYFSLSSVLVPAPCLYAGRDSLFSLSAPVLRDFACMDVPVPPPTERAPFLFAAKRFFVSPPDAPAEVSAAKRLPEEFWSCFLLFTLSNFLLKELFVLS